MAGVGSERLLTLRAISSSGLLRLQLLRLGLLRLLLPLLRLVVSAANRLRQGSDSRRERTRLAVSARSGGFLIESPAVIGAAAAGVVDACAAIDGSMAPLTPGIEGCGEPTIEAKEVPGSTPAFLTKFAAAAFCAAGVPGVF